MSNVTVIGAQWGDEGKGKIIDWLSNRADMVVRFQGGNNAGHTIVVGDKTYKLSLLPSGVVQGKRSIIGNGVVVDPWSLLEEIARVGAAGLKVTSGHPGAGRECRAGAAAAPRTGCPARGSAACPEDSAPPSAASAPPMKTRWAAAPSRHRPEGSRLAARQDRAPAGPSQCAAQGLRSCRPVEYRGPRAGADGTGAENRLPSARVLARAACRQAGGCWC